MFGIYSSSEKGRDQEGEGEKERKREGLGSGREDGCWMSMAWSMYEERGARRPRVGVCILSILLSGAHKGHIVWRWIGLGLEGVNPQHLSVSFNV